MQLLCSFAQYRVDFIKLHVCKWKTFYTGKNNGFPVLDIFGYLKNTHKNPKFGRVRQVPIWELGWEFRGWDLSHFAKFGICMGILQIPKNIQNRESVIFSCVTAVINAKGEFCWTLNAECSMPNDSEVWGLGLGNWVNHVSGQFSQYNNSKWNLILSVS